MNSMTLRTLAATLVFGLSLAACGAPEAPVPAAPAAAPTFVQADAWASQVDGADAIVRDGLWRVTASNETRGYQVAREVATNGARSLTLRYDIETQGGPGFIGVLTGDRSQWLGNYQLQANTRSSGEQTAAISGDTVLIVLQTDNTAAASTSFTLHNVEYALQ